MKQYVCWNCGKSFPLDYHKKCIVCGKPIRLNNPELTIDDCKSIGEWYRASHHGYRCNLKVGGCHKTRNKIYTIQDRLFIKQFNKKDGGK